MKKKDFSLLALSMLSLLALNPMQALAEPTTVKTVDVSKQVYPSETDTKTFSVSLDLSEVATTLGTDTATLSKSTDFLYGKDIDGNLSNSSTTNAPGFWFTKDGVITKYSLENHCFYAKVVVDALKNKFDIEVGLAPTKPVVYATYKTTLFAVVGDKQMELDVTLDAVKKPIITVDWNKVQFVKTFDVAVDAYPQNSYDTKGAVIKLSDVAAALGTDTAKLIASDVNEDSLIWAKDTLGYTKQYTAGYDGFWLSSDGKVAGYGTQRGDNSYDTWYVLNELRASGDSLTFWIGQRPGYFAADSVVHATEYIVYNDKAVTINLTMKIVPAPTFDWDNMTNVATYNFKIKKNKKDGYTATPIKLDMADIASKLGVSVSTLNSNDDARLFAIDAGGGKSDNYTAGAPGFWFAKDGTIMSWGENAYMYVEYHADQALMNLGFYPKEDTYVKGDSATVSLFLAAGQKYTTFTITVEVIADTDVVIPPVTEKPAIAGEYPYSIGVIPSADTYLIPTTLTVNLNDAAKALGESTDDFIAHLQVFSTDSTGNVTNNYTCTPTPGFWFTKDGKAYSWGPQAYVGCTYATNGTDGVFTFFQFPGRNKLDDVTTFQMWLVDPVLKKAVVYDISLNFVSTLLQTKVVGSTDLNIALLPTDADAHNIEINLSDVATSFGVPSSELKSATTTHPIKLYATTATGMISDAMTSDYGFWYNKTGAISTISDPDCSFGLSYYGIPSASTQDFDNIEVSVWGEVQNGDVLKGTLNLGIEDEDMIKLYACNVTIWITNDPTSVNSIATSNVRKGNVYDLSGRLVRKNAEGVKGLVKGIYLFNGKKIVVK
jgi:hypothetical protein